MRVAHTVPVTWRGRSITEVLARLDLHAMAVSTVRRVTDEGENLFARLRAISAAVLVRIHKGRSESQGPSALERLWEEIAVLHVAGVSPQLLALYAVETLHLIDRLELGQPATPSSLLGAIHRANLAQAQEGIAESQLLTHGDFELSPGDLDRLADATKAEIAAKQLQLSMIAKLRSSRRPARAGMGLLQGRMHA